MIVLNTTTGRVLMDTPCCYKREDAIRNAISLGGDSDTLACMAGSIAEAYYGLSVHEEIEVFKRLPDDLLDICFAFETVKIKK